MNEQDFTRRLESTLESGLASTPLPAPEPARARYWIATAKVGRGHMPRLMVAIVATGFALFAGVVGAAASGTSPATLASVAVHDVVVVFEEISNHRMPDPSTSIREPGLSSAPASEPTGLGHEPVAAAGSGQAIDSPAPVPTEEPAPDATETPEAVPSETTADPTL